MSVWFHIYDARDFFRDLDVQGYRVLGLIPALDLLRTTIHLPSHLTTLFTDFGIEHPRLHILFII